MLDIPSHFSTGSTVSRRDEQYHHDQPMSAPPALDSQRLLQGSNEVLIRHGGETYRLRHTRNDKLILTK